jgi:hypothetical protein
MCFSASGSFVVSGVLVAVGTASLAQAKKPFRMLGLIPLLFAAQQAAEGVVWLTVASNPLTPLHQVAVDLFLGFALVLWPLWLPWSLLLVESDPARKRLLGLLVGVGTFVSVSAVALMSRWQPRAHVVGHSISYDYEASQWPVSEAHLLIYLLPTVLPFFVSTLRLTRVMGGALLFGLATTIVLKRETLTSVWCFFAALLSVLFVIAVVREQGERKRRVSALAMA